MCLLCNRTGGSIQEPRLFHRFGRPARKIILGIGLAAAMHLAHSADNLAFAQFAHYEPYMAVDIADLAGPESDLADTLHGEAMDVNAEMFACGWYEDSGGFSQPFFLDPRDGGDAYILPLSTYEFGAALALSESADYDITGIIVVGWVQDYPAGDKLAAYWEHNGTTWELNLVPDLTSGYDSYATDVGPDGDYAVGYEETGGGVPYPFIFDRVQESSSVKAFIATAMGIDKQTEVMTGTRYNGGDEVAYHYVLGAQSPTDLPNPDDETYEETYGMAVNEYDDVVGYALDTGTGTKNGVLWYYDGDPDWTPYVLEDDNPDPVESTLTDVANKDDGTVDIVGTYAGGGAFYVTIDDSGEYYSYSLDQVSSGPATHLPFVLFPLRIRQEVEENSWTPATYSANGINSIGTIAGSYWDGAPSDDAIRPCIFVANDMNNNGEPDFREILQSQLEGTFNLDQNGNWMLDWAENYNYATGRKGMRCGLHAPGYQGTSSSSEMIYMPDTQIIRLPMAYEADSGVAVSYPTNFGLLDIVYSYDGVGCDESNELLCDALRDSLTEWGTSDGDEGEQQREIIITLRNRLYSEEGNFDVIPGSGDREDLLEALKVFSFRFAPCIDYIQAGNESFSGAGEFFFDDVGEEGTKISDITDTTTYNTKVGLVIDWVSDQAEAARIGSALRGRPLRVISPGFPAGDINVGYTGNPGGNMSDEANRAARAIADTTSWCNDTLGYVDSHLHYVSVAQATNAVSHLVSASAPWNEPEGRVVLELSPKVDDEGNWWDENHDKISKYALPEQDLDPWDTFVGTWKTDQFGGDFDIDGVMDAILADDFAVICYGPSTQSGDLSKGLLDVVALRASSVLDEYLDTRNLNNHNYTTIALDVYISELGNRAIDPFEVHCDSCCDQEIACPDCPDN